jgi:hypothetical protein
LILSGLHGVTSQKRALFTIIAYGTFVSIAFRVFYSKVTSNDDAYVGTVDNSVAL